MKLSNVVSIILPLVPLVLAATPKVNKVEFMSRHVPYESMDIEVTSVVLTFDQDVFTPDYESMFSGGPGQGGPGEGGGPGQGGPGEGGSGPGEGPKKALDGAGLKAMLDGPSLPPLPLVPLNNKTMEYWVHQLSMAVGQVGLTPVNVDCEGTMHVPAGPQPRKNGPAPVMFFPYSINYVEAFLNSIIPITDADPNVLMAKNKLVVYLFSAMRDPVLGTEQRISNVPDFAKKFADGKCKLVFQPLLISDAAGNKLTGEALVSASDRLETPACNQQEIQKTITEFNALLNSFEGAADDEAFRNIQGKVMRFTMSDAWVGCEEIMRKSLQFSNQTRTSVNKECTFQYGTLQFAADPCCNKTLSMTLCCAPRSQQRTVPVVSGVNAEFIATMCQGDDTQMADLFETFSAYAANQAEIFDPNTGCAAVTASTLGASTSDWGAVHKKYFDFMTECNSLIFGPGGSAPSCLSDADCYTNCVVSNGQGTCSRPFNNPAPYFEKCYADRMDPALKAALMRMWGIYDVSNMEAFSFHLRNKTSRSLCQGPASWLYNGGWFQRRNGYTGPLPVPIGVDNNGRDIYNATEYYAISTGWNDNPNVTYKYTWCQGGNNNECFQLPPNQVACETETACNWNNWNGADCMADKLDDGGNFCAATTDEYNHEVSIKSQCVLGNAGSMSDQDLVTECASLNSTAIPRYSGMAGGRCELTNLRNQSMCIDACFAPTGPKPVARMQCINRNMTMIDCVRYNETAMPIQLGNQAAGTAVEMCTVFVANATCVGEHGANGFQWTFQEPTLQEHIASRCRDPVCFNAVMNFTDCNTNGSYWDMTINNGTGACKASASYSNPLSVQKTDCEAKGAGWTFYAGREWYPGRLNLENDCKDKSICDLDLRSGQGKTSTSEQCAAMSNCDRSCTKCQQNWNDYNGRSEFCSHPVEADCQTPAVWNSTFAKCIYSNQNTKDCLRHPNATMTRCANYATAETCQNNPFKGILSCHYSWATCDTQQECNANGECEDREMQQLERDNSFQPIANYNGTCVLPPRINPYGGFRDCSEYSSDKYQVIQGRLGCLVSTRDIPPSQCVLMKGKIVFAAKNQTQCLSHKACCEPGMDCSNFNELTSKSAEECTKCGGSLVSLFGWRTGQWNSGSLVPLQWKQRQMVSRNKWVSGFDSQLFGSFVQAAISNVIGTATMIQNRCMFGPTLSFMKTVACSCGVNLGPECSRVSKSTKVDLGSSAVSCGASSRIRAGGVTINIDSNSVTDCTRPAQIGLEKAVAKVQSAGASGNPGGNLAKRSVVRLGKRSTTSSACYAMVVNSNTAYIGQLRGDCLVYSPNVAMTGIEICLPLKDSIPFDATAYPVAGIATTSTAADGSTIYTASATLTAADMSSAYCVTVDSAGTYCPVSLKTGWSGLSGVARPACDTAQQVAAAVQQATVALISTATQLKITTQPSASFTAGGAISLVIEFQDASGALVPTARGSLTLSILTGSGTSGAALAGARALAVGGRATFSNVRVEKAGVDYQLVASASLVRADTTSKFTIVAGAAAKLAFTQNPAGALRNLNWVVQPQVSVQDAYGNLVSTGLYSVSLAVSGGLALLGTTTATSSTGVATFSGLKINALSDGVILTASASGLGSATSDPFNIVSATGQPFKLTFATQPAGAIGSQMFTTQPIVQVLDGSNATVNTATNQITLGLSSSSPSATLSGTTSGAASSGQVSFTDLIINRAGNNFQLVATSVGLVSASSAAFNVGGVSSLVVTVANADKLNNATKFNVTVEAKDGSGNVFAGFTGVITIGIKSWTGVSGAAVSGLTRVSAVSGVARFTGLSIGVPGYVLSASTDSGLGADSAAFKISSFKTAEEDNGDGDDDDNKGDDKPAFSPALIGGIAAGIAVVALIAGGAVLYSRKKRRQSELPQSKMTQVDPQGVQAAPVYYVAAAPQVIAVQPGTIVYAQR